MEKFIYLFKEQNGIIEQKLITAHEAKDQELIDKYDINKIIAFLETKLSHLEKTFTSTKKLTPLRSLLSTICMSGFNWSYPGISYKQISPLYQAIRNADKPGVNVGSPTYPQFEKILAFWDRLRQVYKESH